MVRIPVAWCLRVLAARYALLEATSILRGGRLQPLNMAASTTASLMHTSVPGCQTSTLSAGEEDPRCKALIKAHIECLRKEGFNV